MLKDWRVGVGDRVWVGEGVEAERVKVVPKIQNTARVLVLNKTTTEPK